MGACHLLSMRIIARRTLRQFIESRAGRRDQQALKAALDAWFDEVRKAKWSSTADVKRLYASASIISSDRMVFNIRQRLSIGSRSRFREGNCLDQMAWNASRLRSN